MTPRHRIGLHASRPTGRLGDNDAERPASQRRRRTVDDGLHALGAERRAQLIASRLLTAIRVSTRACLDFYPPGLGNLVLGDDSPHIRIIDTAPEVNAVKPQSRATIMVVEDDVVVGRILAKAP